MYTSKRQNRICLTKVAFGLLVLQVSLTGCSRVAEKDTFEKEVRARRFVLTDEKGNIRAEIGTKNDDPGLRFFDKKGKPRAELALEKGEPLLMLFNEKGIGVATLAISEEKATLLLHNGDGTRSAILLDGALLLFDDYVSKAKPRVELVSGGRDPHISLYSEKGEPRASLFLKEGQPQLLMANKSGKVHNIQP